MFDPFINSGLFPVRTNVRTQMTTLFSRGPLMKNAFRAVILMAAISGLASAQGHNWKAEQSPAVHHDVSIPLRDMPRIEKSEHANREHPVKPLPQQAAGGPDSAVQSQTGLAVATTTPISFA